MNKTNPSELLLDYEIYPRHQIDPKNVANIRNAREAGVKLPPVIADRKTKKVVDGFHRVTDALRAELPEIAVEWRTYKTEADMLADAIALNMHGRPLADYDKARCILLAEKLHLEPERLAGALGLTVEKIEDLRLRKTAISPQAELVPIKATMARFAGSKLSKKRMDGNDRSSGMQPLFYVNQVINLLASDLIDYENERLMAALEKLGGLLEGMMAKK